MTFPDDSHDDPGKGAPDGQTGSDLPFDEEQAWRSIVENYGERARLDDDGPSADPPSADAPSADPPPPDREPVRGDLFDRGYLEALAAQAGRNVAEPHDEEHHFVPPEPPPLPRPTPARRLAWLGLFGGPLLLLLAVIGHWVYPMWLSVGLVGAFVGGFVFLVATMERRGGDGWGGDDGAVV